MEEIATILSSAEPIALSEPIQVQRNFDGPIFEAYDGPGVAPGRNFADIYDAPDGGNSEASSQQYPPGTVDRSSRQTNAPSRLPAEWDTARDNPPVSDRDVDQARQNTQGRPPSRSVNDQAGSNPSNGASETTVITEREVVTETQVTTSVGQLFQATTDETGGHVTLVAIDSNGNQTGNPVTVKTLP
jgi:hypothetical protein